jgi:hypothetical protein
MKVSIIQQRTINIISIARVARPTEVQLQDQHYSYMKRQREVIIGSLLISYSNAATSERGEFSNYPIITISEIQ